MNSAPSSSSLKRKYDTFSDSAPSAGCQRKYDVFLSFRGEDTRKRFVSHLYDALVHRGVYTYKDDVRLEKGTNISPELVKAIEESRSAIVVLSKTYASSTWCLEELCHILKCCQEKDNNYKVFPAFCYVEPTDVRNLTGDFGKGFAKNGEVIKENISKIEKWRKALHEIAALSGWELKDGDNQTEAELIKIIVKDVSAAVSPNIDLSIVSQDYVGMDVRLEEVNQLLDLSSDGVRTIGIWGMGGIGKTTIAQLIFEQFKNMFEASCFVQNVRETLLRNGSSYLQEYLLKCLLGSSEIIQSSINGRITLMGRLGCRKVLIVLDDVNKLQEIEDLIGKRDIRHCWFGEGSRIIVTTRDKHLLKTNGVDGIYEVRQLSISESRQLLFQKAFKKNSREEYSYAIEGYANDHPFGLDVLGSLSIEVFEGVIRYSNDHPLGFDIFDSLSIEKNLIGAFEGIVRYANGHPLALNVLGSSLYEENVNKINVNRWMNTLDQLKQYPNQEILCSLKLSFDGLNEPEKEIFLDIACFFNNINYDYLVKEILGSIRSCSDISINNLESKSLIRTRNVRGQRNIEMHDLVSELGKYIVNKESPSNPGNRSRVYDFNDVSEVLTNNLGTDAVEVIGCSRYQPLPHPLRWTIDSLLKMPNLKCLISQDANIEFLTYKCDDEPRKSSTVLKKLVVVDLRGSNFTCDSIDFSIVPNLQRLYLHYCRNLGKLDQSIGSLKQLVHLDLSCTDIECLPSNIGNLKSLVTLEASNSAIRKLPSSVVHLSNLKELNLSSCSRLQLPNSLSGLRSLVILYLSDCGLGDGAIPDDISSLSSLKELNLSGNYFTSIPGSISKLFQLTRLDLNDCNNLVCLPKHLPLSLEILNTEGCDLLARYLPIWNLDNDEQIPLMRCRISKDEYKIPRNKGSIKCFPFEESEGMLLKIIWSLEIPESCVKTENIPKGPEYCVKTENIPKGPESCVKTENILKGYTYELCVVYEVFGLDDGYSTLESTHVRKDFLCNFKTDQGSLELEFDILIRKRVGFYALLMFIPGEWFGDQLNRASFLPPSVASVDSIDHSVDSSDHLHVRLKGFNGQFIPDRSTFFNEPFSHKMESHNLDLVMCNDVLHWWRMLGLSNNSRSILLQRIHQL